jgi:hypothetical protein
MAITYASTVTLDESTGLQNATSTPGSAGDADDNDILESALPAAFSTRLSALGAGTAINGALSGYNGANSGANAFSFTTADATGLAFTDAGGLALNGAPSGMSTTAGNEPILLYTDTSNNNILLGKAGGAIVFAAYLEETGTPLSGAKLWMTQYSAIRGTDSTNPDEMQSLLDRVYVSVDAAQSFSLANAPSGQNLFLMMGSAASSIVVTGMNPANQSTGASITTGDTVNTSQGGGSTTIGTNNQMVDRGEGMFFTFVTGANSGMTIPNLDQNEADLESNIGFTAMSDQLGASFTLSQLQKGKTATVTISASNTGNYSGDAFVDHLHDNTAVQIATVSVRNAAGVVVETSNGSVNAAGIAIAIGAGSAVVSGLQAGYTVEYTTVGTHNRLLVQNAGSTSGASFDIGGFRLLSSSRTTDEIGSQMRFEDAGPTVASGAPVDTAVVNTQDADTKGPASDTASASFAAAFAAMAGNYDTDGAGSTALAYAFSVATQGGASGLSSHGVALNLFLDGSGKVVASTAMQLIDVTAANTVFDLAVDAAGLVTLNQHAQIDHDLPGVGSGYATQQAMLGNGLVGLVATATVVDGDGDSASGSMTLDMGGNVKFDDDGPGAFAPASVTLDNSGSDSETGALNAAGSEGADITGSPRFVDTNGDSDNYLYASNGSTLLKSGGQNIVLSGYGSTTLTGTTEGGGQVVFTATLNPGTDQYTISFLRSIDDGAGTSFLGAAPVRSGNPTFNLIDNVGGTTLDLLFSGGDTAGGLPGAHSVNVSTTGAGVDNQSMNAASGLGETLRIDFATGASLAGSPLGSDFNMGTHKNVNGFSFLVSQNTPSGTEATAYVKVFDADGDKNLVGDADDMADTITQVLVNNIVVYDSAGGHSGTVNGHTVSGMLYNGGVIITGLNEGMTGDATGGDDPRVTVRTATGYNRVEVSNFAGQTVNGQVLAGTGFDIAPAGVEQGVAGNPVGFTLPVRVTDYDGDWGPTALIGVNLTPLPVV